MSWSDYHRRRAALDAVLAHLRSDPGAPVPFHGEVAELFDSPAQVLLALHYRWTLKLTGRIGLAQAEADRDPDVDLVDAVTAAWLDTAAEHGPLRAVIDAHAAADPEVLRPGLESEQRMLALAAGLVGPDEPRAEITRVGAAFTALLRTTPRPHRKARHLFGRFAASA
ncbi:hypothetical protein [Actinokineospora globicatena]|uniref:hypothetical protein n=1 Tax=Actinokineospora globicatena TaxID=103729 RepID=UPI0020A4C2EC|nr:hypothetical protein [Actinokineospora globicatena]MCP2305394.1 hypothetical protein [Actinokineospora globicatena]GLW81259.1 hypothetical protein Aglo01_57400 [Actinokineospora globicatena]GLW88043.1 hypothetical protein Aglo02_56820 [Actinokineospora globicatena]